MSADPHTVRPRRFDSAQEIADALTLDLHAEDHRIEYDAMRPDETLPRISQLNDDVGLAGP